MPTVSVLYIDDGIVAPLLELIRNICEPTSRSRPHVTVRYFDRLSIPAEFDKITIGHIDLMEVDSFKDSGRTGLRTVFVRCDSDELLPLEHKPHFPASDFHITLYDGMSADFAQQVLSVLQTVHWGFRVTLPASTRLTTLNIGGRRAKAAALPREYPLALRRLFLELTGDELSSELLATSTERRRLTFLRAVCRQLNRTIRPLPRVDPHSSDLASTFIAPESAPAPEIHLTPPELAEEIARHAVSLTDPDAPIDFGDPAVGTGAFYSALLQVVPRSRIRSAIGIEVNPEQATVASRRWARKGMRVVHADYLHMDRLSERNLILANPPYLRHQGIPASYKAALRQRASVVAHVRINARAGLYVYFLLLSHHWLAPEGISAWLIPTEFMQTDYGLAIRDYLSTHVQLLRIHQFSATSPQFENAKVLPSVVIFRNRPPVAGHKALLTSGGGLSTPQEREQVLVSTLATERRWLFAARGRQSQPDDVAIEDLFSVQRGIATGANAFFIMPRAQAQALGIPDVALRPVLPKVKTLARDVIDRCPDGYPALSPQLVLIDCSLPEGEIERLYPGFAQYLASRRDSLVQRNLIRHRKPWYSQERRKPAPFVCNYMGRGHGETPPIRFLWNKSDAVVTNTYLMLYPRPPLATFVAGSTKNQAALFDVLRSASRGCIIERLRMHADGLYKIEPRDLLGVRLELPPALRSAIQPLLKNNILDFRT